MYNKTYQSVGGGERKGTVLIWENAVDKLLQYSPLEVQVVQVFNVSGLKEFQPIQSILKITKLRKANYFKSIHLACHAIYQLARHFCSH